MKHSNNKISLQPTPADRQKQATPADRQKHATPADNRQKQPNAQIMSWAAMWNQNSAYL